MLYLARDLQSVQDPVDGLFEIFGQSEEVIHLAHPDPFIVHFGCGSRDTLVLRKFVDKCVDLLDQQVNLLIIDPFPPRHPRRGRHSSDHLRRLFR